MTLRSLLVITSLLLGLSLHAQVVTIHVETPGTLSSYIASNEKDQITSLTLTGDLNGTDIRYIREMAGGDVYGNETSGKLSVLDISGVNIVAGGDRYYYSCYSSENTIGNRMFYGCTQLTSATIPNSVISIGDGAFWGCSRLSSITIPNNVTSIGVGVFCGCNGLIEILVSEENISFCSVDGALFSKDKSKLISYPYLKPTSYTVPNSVTSIGGGAFWGCSNLTSVTIPNSVTSIGDYAFSNCSGLTSVTIPSSVTSIGDYAFSNCSGLTSVTNPNSVTSIGDGAFSGCSGLTAVTIGNCVTSIGAGAFSGCSGLTSVTIPNGVTSIGDYAFAGCSGLTSVTIPNSVISIGDGAFELCSGLTSVTIPKSVTSIGGSAFSGCSALKDIICQGLNPAYLKESSCFNGVNKTTCILWVPKSATKDYSSAQGWNSFNNIIEEGTVVEYDVTLQGAGQLLNVLGVNNFKHVAKLTISGQINGTDILLIRSKLPLLSILNMEKAVIVSGGVPYYTSYTTTDNQIGDYAFYGCAGLDTVTIPNSVTAIGEFAFYRCSGLTTVTIPNNVTSIGDRAFQECSGLKELLVSGDNTSFCSVDGVLFSKDKSTLISYPNSRSNSYIIPNSVTSIGAWAFESCSGLDTVTIPTSVTSIGNGAFEFCSGLTSITIPTSITSIGRTAFYACSGIKSIYNNNAIPQIVESSVFQYVDKTLCKLYVPKGSYANYWLAAGWGDFANIIEEDITSNTQIQTGNIKVYTEAEAIVIEGAESGVTISVYTESGALVQTMQATDNIVRINVPTGHIYLIKTEGKTFKIAL